MQIDLTDEERDFLLHIALDAELLGLTDSPEDENDARLARSIRAKLAVNLRASTENHSKKQEP